jgi:N6-adenosine-specific RNA methylase IME4
MNKFSVIVSDPAWSFSDSLKMSDVKRGADSNYSTMSIDDIKNLNVKELADPKGCVLALWVPSSLLQEGLDTMKAWGFDQKQTYIWVKTKKEPLKNLFNTLKKSIFGVGWVKDKITKVLEKNLTSFDMNNTLAFFMGRLFRQTHEICLIGTNNNKILKSLKNRSQRSVSFGENLRHSAKPEHLQDSLDLMFPNSNKLEMFARRNKPNWVCVGNEVCNGEDIRDSIKRLLGS